MVQQAEPRVMLAQLLFRRAMYKEAALEAGAALDLFYKCVFRPTVRLPCMFHLSCPPRLCARTTRRASRRRCVGRTRPLLTSMAGPTPGASAQSPSRSPQANVLSSTPHPPPPPPPTTSVSVGGGQAHASTEATSCSLCPPCLQRHPAPVVTLATWQDGEHVGQAARLHRLGRVRSTAYAPPPHTCVPPHVPVRAACKCPLQAGPALAPSSTMAGVLVSGNPIPRTTPRCAHGNLHESQASRGATPSKTSTFPKSFQPSDAKVATFGKVADTRSGCDGCLGTRACCCCARTGSATVRRTVRGPVASRSILAQRLGVNSIESVHLHVRPMVRTRW